MKKAFTLLELIIVVIIIGILASIAIPKFLTVTEKTKTAEALNILGAIRNAQLRYYARHQSYINCMSIETNPCDLDISVSPPKYYSGVHALDGISSPWCDAIGQITRKYNSPITAQYSIFINANGNVFCFSPDPNDCEKLGFPQNCP